MTELDQALSHVHAALRSARIDHDPGVSLIQQAYKLLQAAQQKVMAESAAVRELLQYGAKTE